MALRKKAGMTESHTMFGRETDGYRQPPAAQSNTICRASSARVFDTCDVQALAFDRYNMRFLKPWLERVRFTEEELERFIEFGQGFVSMSPALRA